MRGTLAAVTLMGTLLAALPGHLAPVQAALPMTPRSVLACTPAVSNVGTDVVLTFDDTTPGGCRWTPPFATNVRVLVVGGGGGGGVNGRGGGGGGGVRDETYAVTPSVDETVIVGVGGSGAAYGPGYTTGWNQFTSTVGYSNGGNSSFGVLTSLGGGFGSGCYGAAGTLNAGNGGSGGGSSGCVAGTGTPGQGFDGSTGGGGGGAGAASTDDTGGAGKSSDITGVALGYGGGGGAGSFSSPTAGYAVVGDGGGRGGSNAYGPGAGVNGRGGGGGGGGLWDSPGSAAGARGGDGVVIVRYAKGTQSISVAATPNPVLKTQQATLSATGYSGTGAITYAVTSGGTNCSISGATLTALDVGTCTVTATIAADVNYLGATSAPLTVTVLLRYPQTITVNATPSWVYVPGAIALSATGYSGTGAITYSIVSGSACTLSGSTVTMTSGGSCQVRASIAQDDTYAAATSAPVTVTGQIPPPPPTPPSPPYLTALRAGNGQIAVDWTRPDSEGTSSITEYRVYAAPGGLVCTVKGTGQIYSTCLATGLTNGKPYEFWVTAVNAAGESAPSRRMIGTPRADPPSAPTLISLVPGNEQATASWTPPASDGGGTISEYRVYSASGGRLCTVAASAGPPYSCVITGLQNGTVYQVRVTAVNESGEGPPSEWRSVVPNPAKPGPPRDLAGSTGFRSITVTWKPPADPGTYPVETYQVWIAGDGVACTVSAPNTSCEITGLTPGQAYRARVRAGSKAGWGPLSDYAPTLSPPLPNIGYPEVRRSRKNPVKMTVRIGTTGIRPGTRLYTLPPKTGDEYDRPVVGDNGVAIWKATVPLDKVWYVMWCTDSRAQDLCSPRTLLVDPDS